MSCTGNDIIDLKTIDIARTCKPRFYSKILSAAGQQLYNEQLNIPFHYFVWLLWSVKEAAYKCLQRHQPDLVFSPVNIEVRQITIPKETPQLFNNSIEKTDFDESDYFKIQVVFNNTTLYARSVIYGDDLIHTVVYPYDDFGKVSWGIKKTDEKDPENQSATVRTFLLDRLRLLFPGKTLAIGKTTAGIPFITVDGQPAELPVSLSHHGGYIGYSFVITQTANEPK